MSVDTPEGLFEGLVEGPVTEEYDGAKQYQSTLGQIEQYKEDLIHQREYAIKMSDRHVEEARAWRSTASAITEFLHDENRDKGMAEG